MMIMVYKLDNFSATDDALVYRARRIFHIVCVCVCVVRLWNCVVSAIISINITLIY